MCPDCEDDPSTCDFVAFGYPFCYGCSDHHRAPVAQRGESCPVEIQIERYDQLEAMDNAIEVDIVALPPSS